MTVLPDPPPECGHEAMTDGCLSCGWKALRRLERIMAEAEERRGRRLLAQYRLPPPR